MAERYRSQVASLASVLNAENSRAEAAESRNRLFSSSQRLLIVTLDALGRREEADQAARRYLHIQPSFRISSYARRCPFQGKAFEARLGHLRSAGLPD
jgi:adenylate cyclase